MKHIDRTWHWLAFRLFNLWHTIGFLFKPFLTIGVCLVLTVLLNALLFLVMRWLPEESTLYSLIYALITGVTASFFVSVCIEFSHNYRSNRMRALELSEYFNAVRDFERAMGHLMNPDGGGDEPPMDVIQVVWHKLPELMPVIQKTYDEKKAWLSVKEAESMKLILLQYDDIKLHLCIRLLGDLSVPVRDMVVDWLPKEFREQMSPEYILGLQEQERDDILRKIVDRIFDNDIMLEISMRNWIPVGDRYLDDENVVHYDSIILSMCCRNILSELDLLKKVILKQPGHGYLLRQEKKARNKTKAKEKPMKKPWYLRKWLWIAAALVLIIGVPFAINGMYLANGPIKTRWDAEHVLAYYGEILSFAGTVVLGIIAVWQTRKANDLSEHMLNLEENKSVPMVDLCQINEIPSGLPKGTYQNSLKATVGDKHLAMKEDNTILYSDGDVLAFAVRNISDTYITSLEIADIQYVAYENGREVCPQGTTAGLTGGIRAFAVGEMQYLLIAGVDTRFDLGDLSEEEAGKRILELEITFLLGNTKGKLFRETIRIGYYPTREKNGIFYPQILRKEPIAVVPEP